MKKLKGKPIFTLRAAETGGYDVQVDPRACNDNMRQTYHFDAETQAQIWIRENLSKFTA